MGYFEVNKEYIIKKYCVNKNKPKLKCNGKCHLSKKLNTAISIEDTPENQFKALLSGFKNIFTPLYFSDKTSNFEALDLTTNKRYNDSFIVKDYVYYQSISSPPPQV